MEDRLYATVILESADLDLPNGRSFLLNRELDEKKMVVACDVEYLKRFTRAREFKIYMYGTFKSSSTSFYQLYIIHGDFNGQSFLSNETCVNAFNLIKSSLIYQLVNFSPNSIQIDFEAAAYNAIRRCFPFLNLWVVFFSFWRRIRVCLIIQSE